MIQENDLGPFRDMWIKELAFMARKSPLFTYWLSEKSEVIKPVLSTDVPDIADEVRRFVADYRPPMKQCWANAAECAVALESHGVEIVHGFLLSSMPIKHAWNAYKGVHFDLTAETNNVGVHTQFSASDLEADRKKPRRYVMVHPFTLTDYQALERRFDYAEWFAECHASHIEKGQLQVKYIPKATLAQLCEGASVEDIDKKRLMSLPDNFRCLVAFAARSEEQVRIGVLLSRLPRRHHYLNESFVGTLCVAPEEYAALPVVPKRRPKFRDE